MAKKKDNTAGAPTAAPATAATEAKPKKDYVLFQAPKNINLEKAERRNLPRMIKPGNVPVGGVVSGVIVAIVNSPATTVKGFCIHLRHESGEEFLFPCTGVIRQALAPGREKDSQALKDTLEKEVGKTLVATRKDSEFNEKYKKDQFMFDVYTVKP
jgi:translation elongation factor EF-G